MEFVLPSDQVVLATKSNKYSDLLWALQGGGGQFGIVTTFYEEEAAEPLGAIASVYTPIRRLDPSLGWFLSSK